MKGHLVEEFSEPGMAALPWAEAEAVLEQSEMFWLSTVRRDGRPHVAPLPAVWLDGRLHFTTGAHEQKSRNLDANPRCALTTGTNSYRSGIDVVVEGTAERVTDRDTLTRLAVRWKSKIGWEYRIGDGVFLHGDDDHAAIVLAVVPAKILAFTKAPYRQTRYEPGA